MAPRPFSICAFRGELRPAGREPEVLPRFWRGLQGAAGRAGAVLEAEGPADFRVPSSFVEAAPALPGFGGLGLFFARSWRWTVAKKSLRFPGKK